MNCYDVLIISYSGEEHFKKNIPSDHCATQLYRSRMRRYKVDRAVSDNDIGRQMGILAVYILTYIKFKKLRLRGKRMRGGGEFHTS